MKWILYAAVLVVPTLAFSQVDNKNLGFYAPLINGENSIGLPETGAIILDGNETPRVFKGNIGAPDMPIWVNLSGSSSESNVTSPTVAGSVLTSASISSSLSSCMVNRQTGGWITSCTRNSAGDITLSVASGIFDAIPSCSATPLNNTDPVGTKFSSVSTSSIRIASFITSTAAGKDLEVQIVCVGERY